MASSTDDASGVDAAPPAPGDGDEVLEDVDAPEEEAGDQGVGGAGVEARAGAEAKAAGDAATAESAAATAESDAATAESDAAVAPAPAPAAASRR
ncbi:MAG TPA: hypothetical protein VHE35_05440, partial [Kofleriaceae bacterium]|nr:hypothetical protein [Kofleriaceae bacterium]